MWRSKKVRTDTKSRENFYVSLNEAFGMGLRMDSRIMIREWRERLVLESTGNA